MMEKNMTVVFPEPCEISWEESDIVAPKEHELLVKTQKTMISMGTEFSVLERKNVAEGSAWDNYAKFPFAPGYANIGIVVEVGSAVDKAWIGKRVASYSVHAKYVLVDDQDARVVPSHLNIDHALFFVFAEIVMRGIRRGKIMWGDAVVIYGLGILGLLAARFCRLSGAKPVFAVDIIPSRLEKIPEDVGLYAINSQKDDLFGIVKEVTKGRLADVVFELTGVAELIPNEFEVLKQQGRFVVLSSPRGKTLFDFHDLCNSPSYTIIGAHNYSHPKHATLENPWTNLRDAEYFFDMVGDGEIELEDLITTRINYTEAVDYYYKLLKDRSNEVGIIIEWS